MPRVVTSDYDAEENAVFYYILGLAVSQWAFVEWSLSDAVTELFPRKVASIVAGSFETLDSFRAKILFADAAFREKSQFEGSNYQSILNTWSSTKEKLEEYSLKRNKLAHYRPVTYPHKDVGERVRLMPVRPKASRLRHTIPFDVDEGLGIKDIHLCLQQFDNGQRRLANIQALLLGKPIPYSDERLRAPQMQSARKILAAEVRRMQKLCSPAS